MEDRSHALAREELVRVLTAYTGITTTDGATPANNTLIDTALIGRNDFITEKTILIGSGNARDEDKGATAFNTVTGQITVQDGFTDQIMAGTIYRVLNISSVEIDVDTINTKLGTNVDAPGTTTVFAYLALLAATGGLTLAIVSAMLTLTETGAAVTATAPGTEDNVYINNAPAGVFRPILLTIDTADLAGGETVIFRTRYRIAPGGPWGLKGAPVIFAGVQAERMKDIVLQPNRYGIQVTLDGTTGVVFPWEVFYGV